MRFRAHLTAYDAIDQVVACVQVYEDGTPSKAERDPVVTRVVRVQGTGEDDVHSWLRDVLVAVLEET